MLHRGSDYRRRVRLNVAEFLAWERAQPLRHELVEGEVVPRPIEAPRHYALCVGAIVALNAALRGRSYAGLSSDQRIGVGSGSIYLYPDAGVVSGEVQLQDGTRDIIANPTIVVEVLSHATERHDRGRKWAAYQRLRSLSDYVLVSQSEVRIEHYRRETRARWSYRSYWRGEQIELSSGRFLSVDAIYAGVFELPGDGSL